MLASHQRHSQIAFSGALTACKPRRDLENVKQPQEAGRLGARELPRLVVSELAGRVVSSGRPLLQFLHLSVGVVLRGERARGGSLKSPLHVLLVLRQKRKK